MWASWGYNGQTSSSIYHRLLNKTIGVGMKRVSQQKTRFRHMGKPDQILPLVHHSFLKGWSPNFIVTFIVSNHNNHFATRNVDKFLLTLQRRSRQKIQWIQRIFSLHSRFLILREVKEKITDLFSWWKLIFVHEAKLSSWLKMLFNSTPNKFSK